MRGPYIENYKYKQYKIEENYILNTFFKTLKITSKTNQLNNTLYCKYDTILNHLKYELYKFSFKDVILAPKINKLFEGDFSNIYHYYMNKNDGIHLSITRKKDSIVEKYNYDFLMNVIEDKKEYINVILYYYTMKDNNNEVLKKYNELNIPLESFIIQNEINNIELPKKEKLIEIRKNALCNYKKYITNSYNDFFQDLIDNKYIFQDIYLKKDESLIKSSHNILIDTKNKIKKLTK